MAGRCRCPISPTPVRSRAHGLAYHLDGARLFNAAIAGGVPAREIARHFDSVSVCLSKGLGAPVGSVLLGSDEVIGRARRWRKVLGGGWRQAGILAAMGLHALDHHVERLADDHRRAAALAAALRAIPGLVVDGAHTNLVFVTVPEGLQAALADHLRAHGVLVAAGRGPRLRLATHLDVDDAGIARTLDAIGGFFRQHRL